MQPLAILQPLAEVSAVGETGEAIAVASDDAEPEAMIREGMSTAELEIPLALPKRSTEKIRVAQRQAPGAGARDRSRIFAFTRLPVAERNAPPKRVEQRKAGATVTLDQVRKNNDVWEVSLRVKFESPSTALESHRGWILDNEAYFRGRRPSGASSRADSSRRGKPRTKSASITSSISTESPDKLEFVYRTPITILEMPVDYEFHDLPLP